MQYNILEWKKSVFVLITQKEVILFIQNVWKSSFIVTLQATLGNFKRYFLPFVKKVFL